MQELVGIVAGGVDYGDADRIVHLITRNGRISAFAHGARKSRKRFAGALEPFTTIRATLEVKRGGREGLLTMRSAVVEHARLGLREDLAKIALASYVVELAAAVAPEGAASDAIYELAESALDRLLARPATVAMRRAYELALIDVLGYRPNLDACAICGAEASPAHLDLAHGGLVCFTHRGHAREIGPKTLAWMRAVAVDPDDERGGLAPEDAELAAHKLAVPTSRFFSGLVGRRLKSVALLDDLQLS